MELVIVGSGNIATHFGRRLHLAGHTISQIAGRDKVRTQFLADKLNAQPVFDFHDIKPNCDGYMIAVSDDSIETVSRSLGIVNGIVFHTSGATSMRVLDRNSQNTGVIYPLQTFSAETDYPAESFPVLFESSNDLTYNTLRKLASSFSNDIRICDFESRIFMHVAAVFANNFTNHLMTISGEIAEKSGFTFELLKPLIQETFKKAINSNPASAQTGPAVRNDFSIMKKHADLLAFNPQYKDIYTLLSNSINQKND
jgi:predicted short-subunit dehydrogenase-like oxidoreductase (DUF2520 family)